MNKKLTKIIGLFALLAFGLLLGGTLAYWRIEGSAATTLATGQLKGSLINEYQAESVLYPGGSLNQVISAKNSGDLDMLLRLKVDKMWDDSQLSDEKLHINYNSKYWMDGSDGYYYYKGILEPGEACEEPLCESISLDADASNEYSAKSGKIQATLECLQATSDAVSTWDKTYADLGVEEPKLRSAVPSTVTVTSDKKIEFSPSGEAAMPTFAGLTPGETCTQVVTLKNAYSEDVGFYLSVTGDGSLDKKAADMLSQYTTLTILDNTGKELYKGSAVDSAKAEFELGKAEKGKSNTVTVMLSLDSGDG